MASKYMERCSTLLIIREMQIKITMRSHFTPTRVAIIEKQTENKKCWQEYEEIGPSYIAGGNVKWCSCCRKQSSISLKVKT